MADPTLLWAPLAWLPSGWAHQVLLRTAANGHWAEVQRGVATPPPEALWPPLKDAVCRAVDALAVMRRQEGAGIGAELQRAKPAGSKGRYMRGLTVSSTMGPGVKVDPNRVEDPADKTV